MLLKLYPFVDRTNKKVSLMKKINNIGIKIRIKLYFFHLIIFNK